MPPPLPMRCTSTYSSSSAAGLFVRLLCASSPTPKGSSSSPILDVLLPPRTRAFHTGSTRDLGTRFRNTRHRNQNQNQKSSVVAQRPFSVTTPWRKTEVAYNPQKDEDGNDMLLEITPRAANRLSQIMTKDNNPHLALRISVESGGCHGFQYLMSLTSLPPLQSSASSASASSSETSHPPPETSIDPPNLTSADAEKTAAEVAPSTTTSASPSAPSISEDDIIFSWVKDDGAPGPSSAEESSKPDLLAPGVPKVILDAPSLELLKGSKVDFTMELIGSQFKIVDNPLATSSCGCGTSFDIKI